MPTSRLNGCQVRAARAMLDWSVRELAQRSGISESSIRRIEAAFGVPENVSLDLMVKLRDFFETRGFHFIAEDDPRGAGVQWKRNERRKDIADRRGSGSGPIDASGDSQGWFDTVVLT